MHEGGMMLTIPLTHIAGLRETTAPQLLEEQSVNQLSADKFVPPTHQNSSLMRKHGAPALRCGFSWKLSIHYLAFRSSH